MDKYQVLKEYFGYDSFRDGQENIIDGILAHRDVLAVMPTGAGKSICYQVPALLFRGVTIVVSPLISLMKDQVTALEKAGIPAVFINSSLDAEGFSQALRSIRSGRCKLVYVAPERLSNPSFVEMCCNIGIAFVAVDEAHCISQWGNDFRPEYMRISSFLEKLTERPIVGAFTATATPKVSMDIRKNLGLREPLVATLTFNRPNLYFAVKTPKSREAYLRRLIKERSGQSGIVYCATRKNVENVCAMLQDFGITAGMYHAGLSPEKRSKTQEDFLYDRILVMVATNAFGMGIDKSNVSYVIHYNMPKTLEAYYQEAGRAGRDGEPADCIMLYSGQDIHMQKWLIEHSDPNPALSEEEQEKVRQLDFERLRKMAGYANTSTCLRQYILNYFGEKTREYCGNCSNCLGTVQARDITIDAQKIMSCIKRTGEQYGSLLIAKTLRGSKDEKVLALCLNKQSTYGIMSDTPIEEIRSMISSLIGQGYLKQSGGEYPALALTKASWPVLKGQEQVFAKVDADRFSREGQEEPRGAFSEDEALYSELRCLRTEIAKEEGVPAYVVFSDASLRDMCARRPLTNEEFLCVSGVGDIKAERYGARFLALLRTRPRSTPMLQPPSRQHRPAGADSSGYLDGARAKWNGRDVTILSRNGDIAELLLDDGTKRRIALSVALDSGMITLRE